MTLADESMFKEHLRHLLLADDGLSVESEGTIYIRSLEGGIICAGTLSDDGSIKHETEYGTDINLAIDWYVAERSRLNHGSAW